MTTLTETRKPDARTWRARDLVGRLSLAASPTFAAMALLTATGAPHVAFCASVSGMPPIDGMAWMYLLMSIFHV